MKSTIRLILALMFVGVISISAILLGRKVVGGMQVDFTSDGLYTLSDGTESILGKLNQTITLKLYYSRIAAMKGPDQIRFWNNYYLYVRDLLEEYVRLSGGKIKLELIDPRTYSADEEEAIRNGIKRFPISDDESFYFGMLATTELGKDATIEFFEPNRQELVEYDVSKIISSLMQREKRKIGIVSSLPVMGPADMSPYMMQMMRMQGKQPDPPWMITRQLQMDYEVRSLKLDTHEVPDDIDFLIIIHPKNIDMKAKFAIDQFVMKGGKLMVFVDPHCVADRPPQDPRNPYAGMSYKASSDLNNLLIPWGVVVASQRQNIAVDRAVATKTGRPPVAFLPYLTLNDQCVNKGEKMVADLNDVRMLFAGVISKHGGSATVTPLLSTTKTGNSWIPADATSLNMPDPAKIQQEVRDGTEAVTLACLISGELTTSCPTGIDIEDDSKDTPATQPGTTQPAATQPKNKTKHIDAIQKAAKGAKVIVVADVDIISDMLCYDRSFFGMAQSGSNVPFVLNALEFLSGSEDLISIRSRGRFLRPFTVLDEIERETDRQTQERIDAVNTKIKKYQGELDALGRRGASGQDVALLEATVLAKRRQIEADITAANRELRDLKSIRREKVEALEKKLEYYNTWAVAKALLLVAIILWLIRFFRAGHYATHVTVMTDKKLYILAGVAIALLVGTVVVHSGGFGSARDSQSGSLLIQGLDPQKVSRITIDQGGESLALQRTKDGFVITQRQSYPVPGDKINALFIKCTDIRCEEKITESKDRHKDLGVAADDKEATVVKLLDKDGKVLTGVVVGGRPSRGSGVYVRSVDKEIVYTADKWVSFSTKVSDYVDTELVKVAKEDVIEVRVEQKDSTYTAARDKDGGVVLKDVPKGKRAKQSDVESLFDALSSLTLDDIATDAALAADPDTTFTCKTSKHATYVVKLSKKDDKHYVKLSVVGPAKELVEKSMMIAANEPQAELDKKDAVLTANRKAGEFNLRHNNRVYEIASWGAGKMRKPLAELVEDIPKDDDPEKVAASHILIGYKGSSKSEATRTKAEARKLAEDVLAKAKAHGADFAALAKKHSEGPSGKDGGSLGEFGKGAMHKNFEEASWKLKVGEISGIVETPFGFHVIKRTK